MRNLLFRRALSVSLVALAAGGASAQTPPGALAAVPGLTYEGQIGGMDVWSAPGTADLFAVTPDGRTLMRGGIFSGSGRDIGAAITGATPVDILARDVSPVPGGAEGPTGPDQPPLLVNTDGARGFAGLLGPDSCQSPILTQGPVVTPRVTGRDGQGREAPPPAAMPLVNPGPASAAAPVLPMNDMGLMDGAEMARDAQDALAGFDAAERRQLLLGLVETLRDAQTREQFLTAIAAWRVDIDMMRQARGLSRLYSDDGREPLSAAAPAAPTLSEPPAVEVQTLAPAPAEAVVADEASLEQTLLEDARYNALWFSVGANDAPAVYAFIDPTCSYSARAISALSRRIGAGDLQLRVILAPVLSDRSTGLIAGILTDERPPLAFFDHEVGLAERGRSDLAPAEFSTLPAPVQAGIRRNFEMLRDYGIPGVPFFVYETGEGARVLSGAPDGISFPGALNDPYTGTR